MNYPIIFKLLSVILSTLALAFLLSFGVGQIFYPGELEQQATGGWLWSVGLAIAFSLIAFFLSRKAEPKLFRKEALCVIGLGWILASLVGALPYYLMLPNCTLADAVFESTSGLTTTGATVFTDFDTYPKSLIFWRSLSQWIGGLGVVVFFVAVLSFLGAGGKILYSNEASAHSTEIESGRIQDGVLKIFLVYGGLSFLCTIAFLFCGMNLYDAICHMFATVSTGGFSTKVGSIGEFQSPLIEWTVILFMILGGTSFFVLLKACQLRWRDVRKNTEVIVYGGVILVATLMITGSLLQQQTQFDLHEAVRTSAFQAVSIMTTTGFTTVDYSLWYSFAQIILVLLMLLGGCSGSTAGGAKVIRVVVVIKIAILNIEKAFRNRVVRPIHINGKSLARGDQESISGFLLLIFMLGVFCIPLISLMEPSYLHFEGAFGAMVGCLFNVGPAIGELGPAYSYGPLHSYTKYFLSLLMIMGRLELYAVLVLFYPSLWKRFT